MTDADKIKLLRKALAQLLRQTAKPDPIHPAFVEARRVAADAYQRTSDE